MTCCPAAKLDGTPAASDGKRDAGVDELPVAGPPWPAGLAPLTCHDCEHGFEYSVYAQVVCMITWGCDTYEVDGDTLLDAVLGDRVLVLQDAAGENELLRVSSVSLSAFFWRRDRRVGDRQAGTIVGEEGEGDGVGGHRRLPHPLLVDGEVFLLLGNLYGKCLRQSPGMQAACDRGESGLTASFSCSTVASLATVTETLRSLGPLILSVNCCTSADSAMFADLYAVEPSGDDEADAAPPTPPHKTDSPNAALWNAWRHYELSYFMFALRFSRPPCLSRTVQVLGGPPADPLSRHVAPAISAFGRTDGN